MRGGLCGFLLLLAAFGSAARAADFIVVNTLATGPGSLTLRNMGYEYAVIDNDFRILRRTCDFDQVVRT